MTEREKRWLGAVITAVVLVGLVSYIRHCRAKAQRRDAAERRKQLDRLWTVCEGNGVPAAGTRTGRIPRPTIAFTQFGSDGHAMWDPDPDTAPDSIGKTELVACFLSQDKLIEMCSYAGETAKSAKLRVRRTFTGTIRDPQTGEVIAEHAFAPSEPEPCPESTTVSTYHGHAISTNTRLDGPEPRDEMIAFIREHASAP
jgi:hypothetical protein